MPARRAIVTGRVQGVGFRYFAKDLAGGFEVTGEVWNRFDGAVEIRYEHDDPTVLGAFETELWNGPGRVDGVVCEPATAGGVRNGFQIGRTRP